MSESMTQLEARRAALLRELVEMGDFRRGSVSENWRRCGKPNCACADREHPGHGPRLLWTRAVPGRGTQGRQLRAEEVDKVRAELAEYRRFVDLSERIATVNEAICEARPVPPAAHAKVSTPPPSGEKGGSTNRRGHGSSRSSPPS